MSSTPVTLTVDDARKTLTASSPLSVRALVPFTITPATTAAGSVTLSLTHGDVLLASATATDGTGVLDLSTTAALDLFAGLPAPHAFRVYAELWNETDTAPVASGWLTLRNTGAAGRSTVRVSASGELTVTLAAALTAGTPVMLDDAGEAAACLSANAHRYLGILREGGDPGDTAHLVTAGAVTVTGWALTPGAAYYLAREAPAAITATAPDGYNVRPVGIAADAATLAIMDAAVIQTVASGPHFLTWSPSTRRLIAVVPAAASEGAATAGQIPMTDSSGLLSATFLPDVSGLAIAAHRAQFAALDPLSDPTGPETVTLLNALLSILKTGA